MKRNRTTIKTWTTEIGWFFSRSKNPFDCVAAIEKETSRLGFASADFRLRGGNMSLRAFDYNGYPVGKCDARLREYEKRIELVRNRFQNALTRFSILDTAADLCPRHDHGRILPGF